MPASLETVRQRRINKENKSKPQTISISENDTEFALLAQAVMSPKYSHIFAPTEFQFILANEIAGGRSPFGHEFPDEAWAVDRFITDWIVNPDGQSKKERSAIIKATAKQSIDDFLSKEGSQHANDIASTYIQRTISKLFVGGADVFTEKERKDVFEVLLTKIMAAAFFAYQSRNVPVLGNIMSSGFDSMVEKMSKKIRQAIDRSEEPSFVQQRLSLLFAAVDKEDRDIDGKKIPDDVYAFIANLSDEERDELFINQIQLALSAGTETTVSPVGRALIIIAAHKEFQEELITTRLQQMQDPSNREFDKVAGRLLKEVITKYSPTTLNRNVKQDIEVQGFPLKEGDMVQIEPAVMANYTAQTGGKYFVNNFGHAQNERFCPGYTLARTEMKEIVTALIDGLIEKDLRLEYPHPIEKIEVSAGVITRKAKHDEVRVVLLPT